MKLLRHGLAGEGAPKPFLDHLEDLRRMLLRCLASIVTAMVLLAPFAPRVLEWLKRPLAEVVPDPDRFLRSLEVAGAFSVAVRIIFWGGILISAPFLVLFAAGFVFPGLTVRERRLVTRGMAFAVLLFIAGVALGYTVTLPVALRVMFGLHGWMGIRPEWTVGSYVVFVLQLLIGFGLAFQLPVLVLILGRLGLVSAAQLRRARPYVVIGVLLLAMILTPPDIMTQLMMGVPLWLLYECCIIILRIWQRKDRIAGG